MTDGIACHYSEGNRLSHVIAESLQRAGKDLGQLTTADLASVDEFHIGGRKATLNLATGMNLTPGARVLDLGSGLGGPARTLAEAFGCHVTGIDLTPAFCEAANTLSQWVRLADRVDFQVGNATDLPFADASFDAAMTIHVAMNIAAKDRLYAETCRVLKPGGRFAVYDVLQGEGGAIVYPVPWARTPEISHLATPDEMPGLLTAAGFRVLAVDDSSDASLAWFQAVAARLATHAPAVTFQTFLGNDFPVMARNQVTNLRERRIRTVSYICQA
jgi:SAM-dependent methyltransferase